MIQTAAVGGNIRTVSTSNMKANSLFYSTRQHEQSVDHRQAQKKTSALFKTLASLVPKYSEHFYTNIQHKISLHLGTEWYVSGQNCKE